MMKFFTTLLLSSFLCACVADEPDRMLRRADAGEADMAPGDGSTGGGHGGDATSDDEPDDGITDDAGTENDGGDDEFDLVETPDTSNGDDDMGDGLCRPNRDGTIERGEVIFEPGASAKFAVAEDVTFDTAGTMEQGTLTWDLAQEFPGEYLDVLQLRDPTGQWFEATFPTATYFTSLSASSDLLGVFEVTGDQLLLLGVVSPEDGFFRTELEYDPAIPILQFPLEVGDTWSVESSVSGLYDGTVTVYDENYDFEVDADGVLQTPFGNFQTLRVRSTLDRRVGLIQTIIRSFAFVTECFGTVATISSQENEEAIEFTDVGELKRLAP